MTMRWFILLWAMMALAPHAARADITSNLEAHWKLDDGSGTTAADSSGNGLTGTLAGSPVWTSGKFAGGVLIDASGDYVELPNDSGLNITGPITLAAWINGDTTAQGVVIGGYGPSPFDGYGLGISMGGTLQKICYWNDSGAWRASTSNVPSGAWHHIAVTGDGTTVRFYLDGAAVGAVLSGDPTSYAGVRRLGMPTTGTIAWFPGTIDDVRIYSRPLSASDVAELYNWPTNLRRANHYTRLKR